MKAKEVPWVFILLLIFTCLFFYKIIFTGQVLVAADVLGQYLPWKANPVYANRPHNPSLSDAVDTGYPMKYYATEMIKKGIFPLWDTSILCGTPFWANSEAALFNPFYILFYLLSLPEAFGYISMIEMLLSGLFMYFFMRAIKLMPFGALIAGITYMFNTFFIIWMWHLNFIAVAMWLPLILLFIEKFLQNGKLIHSIFAGIFLGIQFLCGFLQISLYILIGTLIYALIRVIQLKPKSKSIFIYLAGMFLVFVIGFGLGMAQLIPVFEIVNLSQRIEYPYGFDLFDLPAVLQLITFIFPDIYGNPLDYNYWGVPNYAELCGYLGILPVILCLVALFYRKDKQTFVNFMIGIFALSVYLNLPTNGLLSKTIPGYSQGIAPNRIIFLYLFSGAVLAGLGADYLESAKRPNPKLKFLSRYVLAALSIIIIFISSLILALRSQGRSVIDLVQSLPLCNASGSVFIFEKIINKIQSTAYIPKYYHLFSPTIYLPLGLIFLSLWLLNFYIKKGSSFIFKAAAILIIIIDLFYFGMRYITTVDKGLVFPRLEAVDFLKREKDLFRVLTLGNVFPKSTLVPYNIQSAEGYISLFPKRYEDLCLSIEGTDKIGIGTGVEFSPIGMHSPLINLLNVKYILSDEKIEDSRFKLVYDSEIYIYENKDVLPRAFIVPRAKIIRHKDEILRELNSSTFNPKEYVILEEDTGIKSTFSSLRDSAVGITDYSANIVKLYADVSEPAFLVLLDTYYPGWKVYVDDKEDKIYRANYTFRAVRLGTGRHLIKFVYRPFSFIIGLNLTLFTLIVSLTAIILLVKKRRA